MPAERYPAARAASTAICPIRLAQLGADGGRRRLLDQLLMAPLDRAVALAEMDDVAVRVREHLHLDVARILEVLLDVDRRVGEVRQPFALRRLERLRRLVGGVDDLHALPAAARGRLDQQRVADLLAERDHLGGGADRIGRAGDDRHARGLHRLPRAGLRAHQLDRGRRRPDPDEARSLDRARERGVLGEEAVPGMDRPGARSLGRGEQLLDDEIALGRRVAAEREGLVGVARMLRDAVGIGVNGDRGDPQVAQRAEDANRDLAAIRDEDFRERGHSGLFCRVVRLADQLTLARVIAVPVVDRPVRGQLPGARLLGDGRLHRGDGDRLVRRADRPAERRHLDVRLARRPDGRQAAGARDAGRAARPARLPGLDGRRDRRRASCSSRGSASPRSSAAS